VRALYEKLRAKRSSPTQTSLDGLISTHNRRRTSRAACGAAEIRGGVNDSSVTKQTDGTVEIAKASTAHRSVASCYGEFDLRTRAMETLDGGQDKPTEWGRT